MFDDWHWVSSRRQFQDTRQAAWLAQATNPVVIELGAGTAVPTVRYFSNRIVRQHQGKLIRINPREPEIGGATGIGLSMGALEALEALDKLLDRRA